MKTLKIAQASAPSADDNSYWDWSVWLEGEPSELDKVSSVVWKLHPSFPDPTRTKKSRDNKFKLEASGWGVFEIQADVHRGTDAPLVLRQWLNFEDPAEKSNKKRSTKATGKKRKSAASRPSRSRTLFLCYSRQNAQLAGHLAKALREDKIDVVLDVDIPPGEDLHRWSAEKITHSDAMVVLMAEDPNAWLNLEIEMALSAGVQLIPVYSGPVKIPKLLADISGIQVKPAKPEKLGPELARRIDSLLT